MTITFDPPRCSWLGDCGRIASILAWPTYADGERPNACDRHATACNDADCCNVWDVEHGALLAGLAALEDRDREEKR